MKNNFLQEAYGGLREARSKHYCLGLPRKWKVITSTLLLLFTFAISNVWADPQSVTFGTAVGSKGYVYSSSTVADNSILSDRCVYYSSAKNTVSLANSKIIAYRLSLIFELSSSAKVDAVIGNNKDKPVTYVLYSIPATQYNFIKSMSGVANNVATAYIALDAEHPMKTLFKDAGLSDNDGSRQKLLSAVDVSGVTTKLFTSESYTTSTSAVTTIPIYRAATGENKDVLSAGYYAIYIDCGSSSGNTLDNLTFTAVASCTAPTNPAIAGAAAYTEGDNISLTASADGATSATFTWYKGEDWATASAGSSIGSAATLTINSCATSDAGTYWCNISNGTGCEVQVSKAIIVAAAGAVESNIIYTETKGATNTNPDTYYEGVGVASFDPLADVTDFHFTGWSPASIAVDATGDQTIEAQWVDAYNVSFSAGTGSGTVPATFQKWGGATFNLPGQGEMVAPTGKAFDGWKANGTGDKLAANAEYTMGAAPVEFVAQWKNTPTVLFHYQSDISSAPSLNIVLPATGGSLTTRSYKTSSPGSFNAQNPGSYATGTPDDMKVKSGKKAIKHNNSDVYLKLALTSGKLQTGDTIIICGYGTIDMYKRITLGTGFNDKIVSLTMSGTSSSNYGVNTTVCVIPQVDSKDVEYDSLCLARNSNGYIAAIKIIRPAEKEVKSTVISLTDVKVNETSIAAGDLATLVSTHSVDLSAEEALAPTIKFNKHTVITYEDDTQKVTDTPIEVTATDNGSGKWTASAAINEVTYTVTLNIVSGFAVTYDGSGNDGGTVPVDGTRRDEGVSVTVLGNTGSLTKTLGGESADFHGWNTNSDMSSGTHYDADDSFNMPAGDVTLYAVWGFDINYHLDGGTINGSYPTWYISTGVTSSVVTSLPTNVTREGYIFDGWYAHDGAGAKLTEISTAYTGNFEGEWALKAVWKAIKTVTFDGAGAVNVPEGETVASPNSPVTAGKVFQGWYNGENKYDFSAAVTTDLALTSKWADADANHFYYTYNDDFHFDGVVYKTPEGKIDEGNGDETMNLTNPYNIFSGTAGITSIVANNAQYDSKHNYVNAYLKLKTEASSNLVFTIASGYTAVLKMKMGAYSKDDIVVTLKNSSDEPVTPASGTVSGHANEENNFGEVTYNLVAGVYTLTTATRTLYVSHIDLEATALPAHTVTYKAGEGTGDDVEDTDATEVADVPGTFTAPTGKIFNGWKDGDNNDVEVGTIVTGDMTLTAQWINHHAVTFNMNDHGDAIDPQDIKEGAKATRPAEPVAIGFDFGGWFTDNGTFEAPFDFNTTITAATPLFAKWTAFEGCTELWPATSGDALIVGAMVDLQAGSVGGSIKVANLGAEGSIAYNANGLSFSNGGKDSVLVTLNNDLKNGSIIKVRLMANGGTKDSGRGLNLYNAARVKKALLGWQANEEVTSGDIREFTYTVVESDGFAGTNVFTLQRQNSVFLQSIKVEECGDAIVYHNLTSEVSIAGKGIVTLGASSVREGYTTTATYSDIDPLYEFEEWQISGEGATLSGAEGDHVTVTMGTADAVVTLKLRLIPVKFTVNYYDGETPMGTEQVAVNENPTASEITTAKRHYTFLGWSTTNGGDVVALNTITRTETGTVNLYAKYEAVACPTSGTIFSMESDEAKKPTSTVTIAKDASIDLAEYATISGGNAMIINGESSGKDAISTDGEFLLKATKEVMKIELNCVLQEGDIIRIPDNSAKLVISTSNAKTGTYQAFADKNTHEFAVTAAWAGVDDIYVLYDGSSLKFTKVYVIRPAKYTVTFDMKDHGSAIADITNVIEGSKISAPTAPTDAAYSFAGWYKENTLENEWDFDVDVVTDNITLYAKWLDKSDATLKSLKYGSTEIELQAGIYTYAVELPSLTTSVPALTAETSNPNASTVITDDDAFDGEGHASSTVEVTPEKEGAAHQTYTVNFTKLPSMPLLDVDNSIVWNFGNAGTQNNAFTDEVLANFPGVTNNATFRAQTLKATGAKIKEGYLQGTPILFHATKAGLLRVEFANTGGGTRPYRYLVVNGERTAYKSNNTTHVTTAWIEVPAGDVTIEGECVEDANGACTSDNLNFYKIEFLALAYTRDDDWMAPGELGTICYPEGLVAVGADMYEMDGVDANHKFVFYEVNVLEPGKPYLFEAQANVLKFYATTATAADAAGTSNGMIGTFASIDLSHTDARAAKWYYFSGTKFYAVSKRTSDLNVPANRAYVDLNESHPAGAPKQGVRRLTFNVDGMNAATGMDELNASETPVKMLIDGQLFILRGEKMYNANGQLVK